MSQNKKPVSIQEILRKRQQSEFVGRRDTIQAFQTHLNTPWDDPSRVFIFNFHGQGGIGKTTLLKKLRQVAEQNGAVTLWSDDEVANVVDAVAQLAKSSGVAEQAFKEFLEQYQLYRVKQHELESDPDAPRGFAAQISGKAAQMAVYAGRRVPIAGVLFDMMDEESVTEQVGQWATFVTRKLKNKREADLILNPVATLTPLFLEGLNKLVMDKPVVLFFDTYEQTSFFIDKWLRELFSGEYGDLPVNATFIIAGRDELEKGSWLPYESIIQRQTMEPFSDTEAREFLARKNILNESVINSILQLSGRFPLLLATLAAESPDNTSQLGPTASTAVDRFLKWVSDPAQREAALNGALPRELNRDILELLVNKEENKNLFNWLKTMPFVQERGNGWGYHEVVRSQMLQHKRRESPQEWVRLHRDLAAYYAGLRDALQMDVGTGRKDETWQRFELEYRYHQLCEAPYEHLPAALNRFLNALKANFDFAVRWAKTITQAGVDNGNDRVKEWGEKLSQGLTAYKENQYSQTIAMFSALLAFERLEDHPRAIALSWRGQVHHLLNNFTEALSDLNESVVYYPEYAYAYGYRGETYRVTRQLDKAIADFSYAIELDPTIAWMFRGRGQCYRLLHHFDDALSDFEIALKLEPDNPWSYAHRGVTYSWMNRKEEALFDLNRAIEIDPTYAWAISNRGELHSSMGNLEQAETDANQAIKIDSENPSYFSRRAVIFNRINNLDAALADVQKAISLNPDYVFAIALRGSVYNKLDRFHDAIQDLSAALAVEPTLYWAYVTRGVVFRRLLRFEESLSDFARALEADPENGKARTQRAFLYRLIGEYDKAEADTNYAISKNDTYLLAFAIRASVYILTDRYKEAEKDLDKILDSEPENAWAIYCRTLVRKGLNSEDPHLEIEKAIAIARNTYEENPKKWLNTFNLALFALASGDYSESSRIYDLTLSRNPPLCWVNRAVLELEQFLHVFPGHKQAQEQCTLLKGHMEKYHLNPE
ncbi:MAG: tetratricopeptide repeat protein [Ardenticatenaceae bacterium]|nr:tetratricopeptide repeat protein [Ardenticatenaceae bacterium]